MNKYQKDLFEKRIGCYVSILNLEDAGSNNYRAQIDCDNNVLTLYQNENVTLTKYQLIFVIAMNCKNLVEDINYYLNGKLVKASKKLFYPNVYQEFVDKCNYFVVDIDFDNKADYVVINFNNNIVDPVKLDIKYIDADKDKYYKKVEANRIEGLLNKLSLNCKVGDSLVNFYWQNATDSVDKTRIELFIENNQLIMREDLSSGMMFKSIQGLAYGRYYYKVTQYDKDNNVIIETPIKSFSIDRHDSRPTVTNRYL